MTPARLVACGFGSGLSPFAPGTTGSLAALAVGAGLLAISPWALLAASLLACVGGFFAVRSLKLEGDPGWVVIDEFAGQFIALLALATPTLPGLAAAFLLFRLLDITKPGPIGWADRQPGAAGIMVDDILAGLAVGAVLWAAGRAFPALLG
jgi:phosphatidylglycerophosphatase A